MKRKTLALTLALALSLSTGITAFAAPVAVEGGGVFDAEYYAENNPDVVAEAGTDFFALWQHFTLFGINEGRLPFALDTDWQAILDSGVTSTDYETDYTDYTDYTDDYTVEEVEKPAVVYAQEGIAYPISMVTGETYQPITDTVTFTKLDVSGDADLTAPAGYKWVAAEFKFNNEQIESDSEEWYWKIPNDDMSNFRYVEFSDLEDLGYVTLNSWNSAKDYFWINCRTLDLDIDGNTYPCAFAQVFSEDYVTYYVYFMVPKSYYGASITVKGSKYSAEYDDYIVDENSAYTFRLNY
jgi:hypothetical protein